MKLATLGEVCEFKYGKSLPESQRVEGRFPVFGSNGSIGTHSEPLTKGPAIIIGRKGSIGEVHYSFDPCWPIDTTYYIDSSGTSEDIRWLYFALSSLRLTELNKATGVPGLNRNDAYERKLSLPDLEHQRRIAAILDEAEDIRRKRERALELADEFLRSAYIHIVGFKNPGHSTWTRYTIESLAASAKGSMRTGPFGSDLRHSEFIDTGIAVLGIDNAVNNRFAWGERRYISEEKFEKLRRYQVYPGDIIITIMGTTGRSAVVPDHIPTAITTKHLATITSNRSLVEPEFLSFAVHSDPLVISQINQANKGAIMDGLNLGIIKSLKINLPPAELQKRFSQLLRTVNKMKKGMETAEGSGHALFLSLTQRAFRGEL